MDDKAKVRVKALEWPENLERGRRVKNTNGLLKYTICRYGTLHEWAPDKGGWSSAYYSYDDVKAAAQADYEARILSAIEQVPDTRDAALEAAERALLNSKSFVKIITDEPATACLEEIDAAITLIKEARK